MERLLAMGGGAAARRLWRGCPAPVRRLMLVLLMLLGAAVLAVMTVTPHDVSRPPVTAYSRAIVAPEPPAPPPPPPPPSPRTPPVDAPAPLAELQRRARPLQHVHMGDVMRELHGSTDMDLVRPGRLRRPDVCPPRAVIPWAGGRAGNMLFEYLTGWAVARRHGVPLLVPDQMIEEFEGVFSGMTAQRGDLDLLLMDCAHLWHGRRNLSVAHIQDVWQDVAPITGWLELVGYPTNMTRPLYELWHSYGPAMRAELQFSAPIVTIVQEYLWRVRRALSPDAQQLTYIGVHVRHADYYEAMYNLNGVWMTPPGERYFARAVRHYRQRYPNSVFLVVSDDMAWCRRELAALDGVMLFPGDADNPPMLDMALLAHCNHSVITYGTFALSAAVMHGGDVVVATDIGIKFNAYERQKEFWPADWTEISVL